MFDVGFWELTFIMTLALLVLGPDKLPGLVRSLGRWMGRARSVARNLRVQIEREVAEIPNPADMTDKAQTVSTPRVRRAGRTRAVARRRARRPRLTPTQRQQRRAVSQEPGSDKPLAEASLLSHLIELRTRLLRIAAGILLVFLALAPFADRLFELVANPLMAQLPEGTSMIATQVASPFLTPFKTALVTAIFISVPWIFYQIWAFVAPGLYQQEKRMAVPLVMTSAILFYAGVAFAYYLVFPLMFGFFTAVAPEGVAVMTDINAYLDFVLTLFFAFGIAFEVPIATVLDGLGRLHDAGQARVPPGLRAARRLCRRHVPDPARCHLSDPAGGTGLSAL